MTPLFQQAPASTVDHPVALVTGAGSGIGRAVCVLLAREGYGIGLVGRDEARLDETMRQASIADDRLMKIVADVSKPDQAAEAVDRTVARAGRIDALVNNAGFVESVSIEKTTEAVLDRTFAVNAFGPAHLVARAWPVFVKQGGGRVVNVSSLSAHDPFPGLSAYGAAKSALEGLTRSIVNEGAHLGIRAFTVAPGAVETPMLRTLVSESVLPRSETLNPVDVAAVIVDFLLGRRDVDTGLVIQVRK